MVHKIQFRRAASAGAIAGLLMCVYVVGEAAGRNALWHIVNNQCLSQWREHSLSSPCVAVNTAQDGQRQTVVLKDIKGKTQFLLLPAVPVTGIESKILLSPKAPDYFADAWSARSYVEQKIGHPIKRDAIGLAVNAMAARGQDQLHIHVDCLRPDVVKTLHDHAHSFETQWHHFPIALAGETYWVRRVDQPDLAGAYPFRLLAEIGPAWRHGMGRNTLVVAPVDFPDAHQGFVLLARHPANNQEMPAHGEDLQDHACTIAG